MKITESTILTPGRYTRAGNHSPELPIIEVEADGVVLDMAGAGLDGEDFSGVGILVRGRSDVTIRNGMIRGFYQGLQIENCVVSDNHNPVDAGWLADTANPSEDGFGGGIHLSHVTDSLIEGNTTTNNFNGLDLVRCERVTVRGNDASNSGNVGLHLLASCDNIIEDNRADHCIRFAGRFWNDTADSAGILLEEFSIAIGSWATVCDPAATVSSLGPTIDTPAMTILSLETMAVSLLTTPSRPHSRRAMFSRITRLRFPITDSG